jgi:uncharacterized protein
LRRWSDAADANVASARVPALTGRVVDNANLLSPAREAALSGRLQALENKTSDQLVVVSLPDLKGEPIEAVGLRLGRNWGIGQKKFNNGVLLIVAPHERRVRIEVGCGLEGLLTDERAAEIIQTALVPKFEEGAFDDGVDAGVAQIAATLESDARRPRPGKVRRQGC